MTVEQGAELIIAVANMSEIIIFFGSILFGAMIGALFFIMLKGAG